MKRMLLSTLGILSAVMLFAGLKITSAAATPPVNGWYEENGAKYWYENGVRQGTTGRGKEIYDPGSDSWYWLDAAENGKMAVSKDVYMEEDDKWVRYDANGHMIKGDSYQNGYWYRFDQVTGAMIKGEHYQNNAWYRFDETTGVMIKGWFHVTEDNSVRAYFYDLDTGIMKKGEVVIGNDICYFDIYTGVGLDMQWLDINGGKYWYEGGVRQGTTGRGKEIYDPTSQAWYWLDADARGKMAVNKDVYMDKGEKWVRYDANGRMIKGHFKLDDKSWYHYDGITGAMTKGWYSETLDNGTVNTYYYDMVDGKRVHGLRVIDKVECAFDDSTGIALNQKWRTIDGGNYWYEGGKRQGTEGRGKEIYDPASKAWYWLDASEHGRMAVDKDVYQESNGGKWVRYDKYGHMVKGWSLKDGKRYYFDLNTGAMIKGTVTIDGIEYNFNKDTGVLEGSEGNAPANYVWDPVKITYKTASGQVDYYVTYTYDRRGRKTQEVTSSANGSLRGAIDYAYDNDGNLERKIIYNKNSTPIQTYEYTYDDGRKTRIVYTDRQDSSKSYSKDYTYDDKGNLTGVTTYNGRGVKTQIERSYWNALGNLLQTSIFTVSNNKETYKNFYAYQYNAAGNMVVETYGKNEAGKDSTVWEKTYEYDAYGNCTYCVEYDGDADDSRKVRETVYNYTRYMNHSYERSVMIWNADGSLASGYEYIRSGATPVRYTKYGEYGVVEYRTDYDTTAYPTNKITHIMTDYTYDGNDALKQIVETEYRYNQYGN